MTADAWMQQLRDNVARVRAAIGEACARRGRPADAVCLVGVTKYVSEAVLEALVAAGVVDVGESRVQQLASRAAAVGTARRGWVGPAPEGGGPRWHMIGHVQRNKVRALLEHCRIVHALDSQRLAAAIQHQAEALDVTVDALIEVNVSGEASKGGVTPGELVPLVETVAGHDRVRLRGLMTMAPYEPDPEASRPHFAALRGLLASVRERGLGGADFVDLSMGMSQDYAVAVEEGATLVRVGSALFEGLPSADPRTG